jgi:GNAT superfamily N-acetyltransferase
MRSSLGWRDGDPNEELFNWKHCQNPFGESPAWVALHEGRVVGFRTFMRWEFLDDNGHVITAVRAVDTATDPDYRGLGVFRELTMLGVDELTTGGFGFVFNTPNDQSLPGYLKMGWQVVGRLPAGVLPSGPRGVVRMTRARTAADLWSQPTCVGLDAAAFAEPSLAEAVLAHSPGTDMRTHRTPEYLRWRFSLEPLQYRLLLADEADPGRGTVVFRLRCRGAATEAVVAEAFVPGARALIATTLRLLRATGADYALALRTGAAAALPPLPRQGPILAVRPLTSTPPRRGWALALADVELM